MLVSISAAVKALAGWTGGVTAVIPGSGVFGRGRIPAGCPKIIFLGWVFQSSSGRVNFASDRGTLARAKKTSYNIPHVSVFCR